MFVCQIIRSHPFNAAETKEKADSWNQPSAKKEAGHFIQ